MTTPQGARPPSTPTTIRRFDRLSSAVTEAYSSILDGRPELGTRPPSSKTLPVISAARPVALATTAPIPERSPEAWGDQVLTGLSDLATEILELASRFSQVARMDLGLAHVGPRGDDRRCTTGYSGQICVVTSRRWSTSVLGSLPVATKRSSTVSPSSRALSSLPPR